MPVVKSDGLVREQRAGEHVANIGAGVVCLRSDCGIDADLFPALRFRTDCLTCPGIGKALIGYANVGKFTLTEAGQPHHPEVHQLLRFLAGWR